MEISCYYKGKNVVWLGSKGERRVFYIKGKPVLFCDSSVMFRQFHATEIIIIIIIIM